MTIKVGDALPAGSLQIPSKEGPKKVSADELFKGKRVVLFSVPGAFTPTCDARHLPGYIEQSPNLKAKGVDTVACMAVNDAFVMGAWGKASNAGDRVLMVADGNGEYTRALGLQLDGSAHGLGQRGKRFALVAKDGVVTHLWVEQPGEFKVSSAEHVLNQL